MTFDVQKKFDTYKDKLLSAGLKQPTRSIKGEGYYLFYRPATELTAFVVNLKICDDHISVVYGYASTAFTRFKGDENALIERGVYNTDINVRDNAVICSDMDEPFVAEKISQMYHKYIDTPKDELLTAAKEKRKAFIRQFAVKLKPLGFRKKGNSWKKVLEGDFIVEFNVQKSMYSDEYYYNIYVYRDDTPQYNCCFYNRVSPNGMYPMDWQIYGEENMDAFIDETVVPLLEKIGKDPVSFIMNAEGHELSCCKGSKCSNCPIKWEE